MNALFWSLYAVALIGAVFVLGCADLLCRGALLLYRRWRVQRELKDVTYRDRLSHAATATPKQRKAVYR